MAKVDLNPLLERLHGKIGDLVFRKAHTGKLSVIIRADMSEVKWSKAQVEHREKFRQAVIYAKTVMKDEQLRAFYGEMAKQKNKRPFDMAVSDHYHGNDLRFKRSPQSEG